MARRGNTVGANSVSYFFCAHRSIQAKKMNPAAIVVVFVILGMIATAIAGRTGR